MKQSAPPELFFRTSYENLQRFSTILQAGFFAEIEEGESVLTCLSALPGFTADYINDRIQTVFLNGDAIDDLSQSFVGATATIALSAAMPGLAGAILRKNSPHAALRKSKSAGETRRYGKRLVVQIKLFNDIAIERGPELCNTGAVINTADLLSFLDLRPSLLQSLQELSFSGKPVHSSDLAQLAKPFAKISVRGIS